MHKHTPKLPPLTYADKFRQNDASMGVAGGKGSPVAPPCVTRHVIGNPGKPETRKK